MMTEYTIDSIRWPTPVSPLKNRRMDASSVRFQLGFARMRRPSDVFSTDGYVKMSVMRFPATSVRR